MQLSYVKLSHWNSSLYPGVDINVSVIGEQIIFY